MNLPSDKKIVRVEYTYEDGSKYFIDQQNAENYDNNMKLAGGILSTRSYLNFAPVEWTEINKNDKE